MPRLKLPQRVDFSQAAGQAGGGKVKLESMGGRGEIFSSASERWRLSREDTPEPVTRCEVLGETASRTQAI